MLVSNGFCQKDESLGVICQAFLVSSLFSGTVGYHGKDGSLDAETCRTKNIIFVEDFSMCFGRGFFFSGRSIFGGKCIGTGRDVCLSVLDPYDCWNML